MIGNISEGENFMRCPNCNSDNVKKNGSIHNKKPKFQCKDCGRQFVKNPTKKYITHEQWEIVDNLLLEKLPIAGISRVTGISEPWLQQYINKKYEEIPKVIDVPIKKRGPLTIQCDEMWSFVQNKANKQWLWFALDVDSRKIVGAFIGSRDHSGAQGLWDSLPPVYRQCAVAFTDFWRAYDDIFPFKRHMSVGKDSGKTSHIERFNLTVRQRVSRLVRKTLSFSKKLENHIGAVWKFIHHYNANMASKIVERTTT
jgi:IS1 family transposase/transposase-like protein